MTFNRSLFSSAKGTWETPDDLFQELDREFGFDMDATDTSNGFNAFRDQWGFCVFLNPPYGPDLYWWLKRGHEMKWKGRKQVWLLPARTDTRWFHEFVLPFASEIRFIKGRLKFKGATNSAPFPSMIVVFQN